MVHQVEPSARSILCQWPLDHTCRLDSALLGWGRVLRLSNWHASSAGNRVVLLDGDFPDYKGLCLGMKRTGTGYEMVQKVAGFFLTSRARWIHPAGGIQASFDGVETCHVQSGTPNPAGR